jgi:hypothetical protein
LSVAGFTPITASPAPSSSPSSTDLRRDAARIVGRVVRLQPDGERAGQADRVAEARDHAAFRRDRDQVLHAA